MRGRSGSDLGGCGFGPIAVSMTVAGTVHLNHMREEISELPDGVSSTLERR
ncbi:MAG: hypothetical protein AB7G88_03880 [Thermomicrobiales bacterium]